MKKSTQKRLFLEFDLDNDPYRSTISNLFNLYPQIERKNLYLTNKGLFTTVFFDDSNGYHLGCIHIVLNGVDIRRLDDFLSDGIKAVQKEMRENNFLLSYEYNILLRYFHGDFSKLKIKSSYNCNLLIYTFFIDNHNFSKQEIINIGFAVCDLLKEMERFFYEQNESVSFAHFIKWFNIKFIKKLQFLSQYYQNQSEKMCDKLDEKLSKLKYKRQIVLNKNFGCYKFKFEPDGNGFGVVINPDENLPF